LSNLFIYLFKSDHIRVHKHKTNTYKQEHAHTHTNTLTIVKSQITETLSFRRCM